MTKLFTGLVSAALVAGTLVGPASAAKMASKKPAPAAMTMKCPACGMPMPSKKTAMMPVAVKIKGHTYYCCTQCPAGKAHMTKPGMTKAGKKTM